MRYGRRLGNTSSVLLLLLTPVGYFGRFLHRCCCRLERKKCKHIFYFRFIICADDVPNTPYVITSCVFVVASLRNSVQPFRFIFHSIDWYVFIDNGSVATGSGPRTTKASSIARVLTGVMGRSAS